MAIKHPHYSPTLYRKAEEAEDALVKAFAAKEAAAEAASKVRGNGQERREAVAAYHAARDAWVVARGVFINANRAFNQS